MYQFKKDSHGKYDLDEFLTTVGTDKFVKYYMTHLSRHVCEEFGISGHTLNNLIRKLGLKKDPAILKEQTDAYVCQCWKLHKDEWVKRNKESKLRNHGDENYQNKEQISKTLQERYGVTNMAHVPGAQLRKRVTCLEKYGVEVSSQSLDVKEKSKQTRIENYGSYEKSYQEGLKNLRLTLKNKYGVEYFVLSDKCRKKLSYKRKSMWNKKFESLLVSRGFEYEEEFRIENRFYDFRVGKYLFEIDPYPTHNINWSPMSHNEGIDKYYHRKKTLLANKYKYVCIHIFDWTDVNAILDLVAEDSLTIQDTGNIKKFIFNPKTKSVQELLEPGCVEIYDDGFKVVKEKA